MRTLRIFFIVFMVLFLSWTVILRTPWVTNYAKTKLTEQFARSTEWKLEIGNLSLLPSMQILASNVVLYDSESRIKIKNMELNVSPLDLYHGKIGLKSLFLDGLQADLSSKLFESGEEMLSISDFGREIHIYEYHIHDAKVKIDHGKWLNDPLHLEGSLSLLPQEHQLAFIGKNEEYNLQLLLNEKNNRYDGSFEILASNAEIKGNLDLFADGSVNFHDLKGSVEDRGVIEGHISLTPTYLIKNSGFTFSLANLQKFGDITGSAILTGHIYSPEMQLRIKALQIHFMEKTFQDVLLHIGAHYSDGKMTGDAKLTLTKEQHQLAYNAEFRLKEKEKKHSAKVSLSTDVNALLDLFDQDSPTIGGKVNINFSLKALPKGPKFETQIELSDGYYEALDLGTLIQNIRAKITLTPNSLIIQELTGSDGEKGTVSGSGSIQIQPKKQYPFKLAFQFDQFRLIHLDYLRVSATGGLTFTGDSSGAKVAGKLETDSARFTLPEQISELTETVAIQYVNIPEGEEAPSLPTSSAEAWPVALDIEVLGTDHISMRGEGLQSNWQGKIHIQGMAASPKFFGELSLIKGSYLFQGKSFKLTQGNVRFDGDLRKKTTLHIVSEIKVQDRNIEVIVTGPTRDPGIKFRSNPPMSQKEILSWLIFGQGISNLTPFQGSQLNESITSLKEAAKKGGSDPLTKFKNTVGIDRIDIGRQDSNPDDVSLKLGKYISKGTYVSVTKRHVTQDTKRFTQGTSVGIETEVVGNLKLQAEMGDDSTGQLNLLYKRDY